MDEYALRREIGEGQRAKAAMDVIGLHLEGLRAAAIEQIVGSHPEHLAFRERMIVTCQIVDAVRSAIEQAVAAGEAAQYKLHLSETVGLRRA